MGSEVRTVAMQHEIPAGAFGPDPVTLDVRAYLVPYGGGFVLVDTGMDPSGHALDSALREVGAWWSDVSHVLLTHGHPDHVGGLVHARQAAPAATFMAGLLDGLPDVQPVEDGQHIGPLTAVGTPGHTPGHFSFLDEDHSVLLVGDCLGTVDGRLVRAPEQFTADPGIAERTLHTLLPFRGARMLFGHGAELPAPWVSLDALLAN